MERRTTLGRMVQFEEFHNVVMQVSQFALEVLWLEFRNQEDNKKMDCNCYVMTTFAIPCRHNFPDPLTLDDIDYFWHLNKGNINLLLLHI
jgi:hypothetical protein